MNLRPSTRPAFAGTSALIAAGCGTAIASVCALGLFQIERLLGGLWSVAAVLVAGLFCTFLARAFARLAQVVPSGAGLLAYLSRGINRHAGVLLAVPYVLLTLFLVGAEATIVGLLLSRLLPLPPIVGSLLFLVGTWLACRAGIRIGYRAQSLATWALMLGLAALSIASIAEAGHRGELAARFLPAAPTAARFCAGVGQALFLFMGFELLTSHVEIARSDGALSRALWGSVAILTAFYALVSAGFSCMTNPPSLSEGMVVPQLAIADQSGGRIGIVLVVVLSLLASFTSFNGALLALSRFAYALAHQGMLPSRLGRVDPRRLVPRDALAALLVIAVFATLVVARYRAHEASIFAAAVAVAIVYAGAALARERPPFLEETRARGLRALGVMLSVALVGLAIGVIVDAGRALLGTLCLLAIAYGVAGLGAVRLARRAAARSARAADRSEP